MPPLTKTVAAVQFGTMDAKLGAKFQIPGKMAIAENVVQDKTKVYRKRDGFTARVRTTDTGTITAGQGLAATSNTLVLQANDVFYTWDGSKWRNRGSAPQAFPTYKTTIPDQYRGSQSVVVSGLRYTFLLGSVDNYQYRIVDEATGVEVKALTTVVLASTYDKQLVVVGTNLWIFSMVSAATSVITAHKLDSTSPGTAPVSTTYATLTALVHTKFSAMAINGVCYVASDGSAATGKMSVLDTATGAEAASPGRIAFAWTLGGAYTSDGGLSWLVHDAADGYVYLAKATVDNAGTKRLHVNKAAAATLAGVAESYWTATTGTTPLHVSGYVIPTSYKQVIYCNDTTPTPEAVVTIRSEWDGAAAVETKWRGCAIASRVFTYAGAQYVCTSSVDDSAWTAAGAVNLQRRYHLRNASTGIILGRALYGRGGPHWQMTPTATPTSLSRPAQVTVTGSVATMALPENTGGNADHSTDLVSWDLNASYGPLLPALNGGTVYVPGGWPMRVGDTDSAADEAMPMEFPSYTTVATAAGSIGAGTYLFSAIYVEHDNAGRIYRSAPSPVASVTTAGAKGFTVAVPTYRGTNFGVVSVALYMSQNGTTPLYLQQTLANDITADSVTFTVAAVPLAGAEELYTDGGNLESIAPPPWRCGTSWKNRIWLSNTDVDGEVWFSKELEVGRGPEFNELLRTNMYEGSGAVRAVCPIDYNYLAVFKADSIFVLSGAGPDSTGNGNYQPLRLPTSLGCTNPDSVVNASNGCYFQAVDGQIYCLTSSLQLIDVGRGVRDYLGSTVTVQGAIDVGSAQQVWFTLSTGNILCWDYRNTLKDDADYGGLGQWYVWTGLTGGQLAITGGVPCYVMSTGVVMLQNLGTYADDAVKYQPKLKTQPIHLAGLEGFTRLYRMQIVGLVANAGDSVTATISANYGEATQSWTKALTAMSTGSTVFELRPDNSIAKESALEVTLVGRNDVTVRGFDFEAIVLEIGVEQGLRNINIAQRM